MKFIKYFALGLFALFAAVLITAALSSTEFNYQQSITINADQDKVWSQVSSVEAMDQWNPWLAKDPNIKRNFDGQRGEVGSSVTWQSDKPEVGSGKQTITAVEPQQKITTQLHFYGDYESTAVAYVQVEPMAGQTKVTWGFESEMPFPMNAMMLLMSPKDMLGNDFTRGLEALKRLTEQS